MTLHLLPLVLLLAAPSIALAGAPSLDTPLEPDTLAGGDEQWSSRFIPPGPVGRAGRGQADVRSAFLFGDRLIIEGEFAWMDGEPVENVASWDGEAWEQFPVIPPSSFVHLNVVNDELYATGYAAEEQMSPVYRWDGSSWLPLPWEPAPGAAGSSFTLLERFGDSIFGTRRDLYLVPIDSTYGSVRFEESTVSWDGASWIASGNGIARGVPSAMLGFEGDLLACGDFVLGDPDSTQGLARWDGARWEPYAGGAQGLVRLLIPYRGGLIALGDFTTIGDAEIPGIARWDGLRWLPLGAGLEDTSGTPQVRRAVAADDTLYVYGQFTSAGGQPANGLAFWDGSVWHSIQSTAEDQEGWRIRTLLPYQGQLYALGTFRLGGNRDNSSSSSLLRWNGSFWEPPKPAPMHLVGQVGALLAKEGILYAGAQFRLPGRPDPVQAVGAWDGASWSIVGEPFDDEVQTLTYYRNALVAGGSFVRNGEQVVNHIAAWNGTQWFPLGTGANQAVRCLAEYGGRLVAGGGFRTMGGEVVNGIAAWDGTSWSALGYGISAPGSAWVAEMTIHEGKLVACGRFTWAGERRAFHAAAWDGATWTPVGAARNTMHPLARFEHVMSYRGRLFLASLFMYEVFGPRPEDLYERLALSIAEWDGEAFRRVSHPFFRVSAIGRFGPYLVFGGSLLDDPNQMMFYDGYHWLRPGSLGVWTGTEGFRAGGPVTFASIGNQLYVGGTFWFAGDHPSYYLAQWDGRTLPSPQPSILLVTAPNPSTASTVLTWSLERSGHVDSRIFDVQGREVARIESGAHPAGIGSATWDLRSSDGHRVPAGIYFGVVRTADGRAARKIVVLP